MTNSLPKTYRILSVLLPLCLGVWLLLFSEKKSPPIENVIVSIESKDRAKNQHYVEELAKKLISESTGKISRVDYHHQEESRFFAKHMPLFVSVEDLKKIRNFVKESIQFEKDLFDPFSHFKGKRLKEPFLDFEGLFEKYIVLKPLKKLPGGYFANPEGTKWVAIIHRGNAKPKEFTDLVESAIREVKKNAFAYEVEISLEKEKVNEASIEIWGSLPPKLVEKKTQEEARILKDTLQKQSKIAAVKVLSDFVPEDQDSKVAVLKEIQSLLSPTVVKFLSEEERKSVEKFLSLDVFKPFTAAELPISLQLKENAVLVYAKEPLTPKDLEIR